MLVCYLDDSGTHPNSPLVTIGGYVMDDDGWSAYERTVEPIFQARGVPILHAVDLENGNPPFEGWKVINKQAFVSQISMPLKPHGPFCFSFTATREVYERRAEEAERLQAANPYAFGFQVITNWILTSVYVGKQAREEGLIFVVEDGNKNNGGITQAYNYIREHYAAELGDTLRGLSFVPKNNSRAIQMADLVAYYSRRRAAQLVDAPPARHASVEHEPIAKVIVETCPSYWFVANDFGWRDGNWRASAGPMPSLPSAMLRHR